MTTTGMPGAKTMLPAYPSRLTISESADGTILEWLDALNEGRLELWQLPPALFDFYVSASGHAHRNCVDTHLPAIRALQAENRHLRARVERLDSECDRLHLRAYNTPAQIAEIYARRLDQGAADFWESWTATPAQQTETEAA